MIFHKLNMEFALKASWKPIVFRSWTWNKFNAFCLSERATNRCWRERHLKEPKWTSLVFLFWNLSSPIVREGYFNHSSFSKFLGQKAKESTASTVSFGVGARKETVETMLSLVDCHKNLLLRFFFMVLWHCPALVTLLQSKLTQWRILLRTAVCRRSMALQRPVDPLLYFFFDDTTSMDPATGWNRREGYRFHCFFSMQLWNFRKTWQGTKKCSAVIWERMLISSFYVTHQ